MNCLRQQMIGGVTDIHWTKYRHPYVLSLLETHSAVDAQTPVGGYKMSRSIFIPGTTRTAARAAINIRRAGIRRRAFQGFLNRPFSQFFNR